jgi:hypothetical protein
VGSFLGFRLLLWRVSVAQMTDVVISNNVGMASKASDRFQVPCGNDGHIPVEAQLNSRAAVNFNIRNGIRCSQRC